MSKGAKCLEEGREYVVRLTPSIVHQASKSDDPLLFYAGVVAAVMGHVAAALGTESADAIMEIVRPMMNRVGKEMEKNNAH